VLGAIGSPETWLWGAFGKHPAARDFLRLGKSFPLMKGFADWMEAGYRDMASRGDDPRDYCSWRFWARGAGKERLAVGLVKDSSDALGRPFPLLVLGTGPVRDWESRWDLLPCACERTWSDIEYLLARSGGDPGRLEAAVQAVRPPVPEWEGHVARREAFRDALPPSERAGREEWTGGMPGGAPAAMPLDRRAASDPFTAAAFVSAVARSRGEGVPSAFFMGGTAEKAFLAFCRRPLSSGDFRTLWELPASADAGGETVKGKDPWTS
jgi:type VI secretion system protein VasJ